MIRRLINRVFGRARPAPPARFLTPPRAGWDWRAGDVAECMVDAAGWREVPTAEPVTGPDRGNIVRVVRVDPGFGTIFLTFSAFPDCCFPAGHFRKLRPCEAGFRAEMRRQHASPKRIDGAPKPVPEPVE